MYINTERHICHTFPSTIARFSVSSSLCPFIFHYLVPATGFILQVQLGTNPMMAQVELYNGYPLWHYVPSKVAAIIFMAAFALATLLHAWRMFRHWIWFGIPWLSVESVSDISLFNFQSRQN